VKQIRKAVFPVAGFGTRFLPATKAMPKELLPIIDKPIIQFAVEEAAAAGIDTMVFVTGRSKRSLEDHFDSNFELEHALMSKGKLDEARMVHDIVPPHVKCVFVRQPEQLGLGHAVLCARPVVGDDPFAVLLADDFIIGKNGSFTKAMVDAYMATGKSILCVDRVATDQISKYGIIDPGPSTGAAGIDVRGIIEKPDPDVAPSQLASYGRYILDGSIFSILENTKPGKGGEIQLVDAINTLAEQGAVQALELTGTRYDCGDKLGYLQAITAMALQSEAFGADYRAFLDSMTT
jgi:UTP--glucose-1-phosphate uridylyltransferase